jgi:hypothetical protein
MAMYVMLEFEPHRFRSDHAFTVQLVRRLRALTERNVGRYYDHASGKTKRVYRDMPPRATAILGRWVIEALGIAGAWTARLERNELDATREERHALKTALAELR